MELPISRYNLEDPDVLEAVDTEARLVHGDTPINNLINSTLSELPSDQDIGGLPEFEDDGAVAASRLTAARKIVLLTMVSAGSVVVARAIVRHVREQKHKETE
ncbi:MAG: hypothetical protein WD467_00630 [Candidatus Saccharimonadales bacterium]